MAIDPKLLIIKPVSQLQNEASPLNAKVLMYNGGGELKTTPLDDLKSLISAGVKGVLKISDAKPSPSAVGKYDLSEVGTYTNLVPIIAIGSSTPSNTPITTLATDLNSVYWDGINFTQFKKALPQATQSIVAFSNSSFPLVAPTPPAPPIQRTYGGSIWQLADGQSSDITDIPGISSKWYLLKDSRIDAIITTENIPESKNKANPIGLIKGFYTTSGVYQISDNWIHWKGSLLPNTTYTVSGLAFLGNTIARLIFFTSGNVFISPVVLATNNANNVTFTTPANTAFVAINLQNAVGIGLDPMNTVFPNQLQIEIGNSATSFVPYQSASTKTYFDYEKLSNKPLNYSDVFYSFSPNGGTNSQGLLMIYVKRKGYQDKYVGFFVNHDFNSSDAVYTNQWRIEKANNYIFDGASMSMTTEYGGLYLGESEFVYKRTTPDSADFTGGIHGDEILDNIDILVDGIIIDMTVVKPLTACREVRYIQKSKTYTTANIGETLTSHSEEAIHIKITSFLKNKYGTFNSLEFLKSVTGYLYHGICCIGKINANNIINDAGAKVPILSDNVTNKANGTGIREINYSNSVTGFGAKVTSQILNSQSIDQSCFLFLHDRPNDAKYYRNTPISTMGVGTKYKSYMEVEFF